MENENSMKEIIRNTLEEVRAVMDADTVIGQPIRLENGTTVIPVSKVLMGFATGGLDLPAKDPQTGKKNFGGGGGTGVTVFPVGFLTAYADGRVEILPLKQEHATPLEQAVDLINRTPELLEKLRNVFAKKSEEEEKKPETDGVSEEVLAKMAKDEANATGKDDSKAE